jgi:AmiR/NasT family two-component response regulator
MGKGEIWVLGGDAETSRHIAKVLSGLVNPVRTIENGFDFDDLFRGDESPPLLLLLDLSHKQSWGIMDRVVQYGMDQGMNMIGLVDASTEHLVDRAYEVGAKTYLRKPLVFSDFVQRAKLLKMNVLIHPKGHAPG